MEDFFLFIKYKHLTMKFRVTDPTNTLEGLMGNIKKSLDKSGNLIFDLPDLVGDTPTDYFFAKTDTETGRNMVLSPRIGKTQMHLYDYNVNNGDTIEIIPDPIAG